MARIVIESENLGVKNNKALGYAAEREIAARIKETWPPQLWMDRVGLSGGHDLRGPNCIGEVKSTNAAKTGWWAEGVNQLKEDRPNNEAVYLFVKYRKGRGRPAEWWVCLPLAQFEDTLDHGSNQGQSL